MGTSPSAPSNARIAARRDLAEGLAVLRIRLDEGPAPAFEPGQFVALGLPDRGRPDGRLVRRAYTLSSAPGDEALELYVVRVEGGALTPQLFELDVGDRLWVDPRPLGRFTLEEVPADAQVVAVGTGTGLAPYVSMLRAYAGRGRWRRFVLLHGVRTRAELGYREELEALAARDPAFVYVPCVSREADWPGRRGRVQAALRPGVFERLAGEPLDPRTTHVFLCGNPAMVAEVGAWLEQRGFVRPTRRRPGTLHLERYW